MKPLVSSILALRPSWIGMIKFQKGVIYYLAGGRVRGVLLWNVWDSVPKARALIAEPGPFTAADLKGRL